jgi:hypothetical protein
VSVQTRMSVGLRQAAIPLGFPELAIVVADSALSRDRAKTLKSGVTYVLVNAPEHQDDFIVQRRGARK